MYLSPSMYVGHLATNFLKKFPIHTLTFQNLKFSSHFLILIKTKTLQKYLKQSNVPPKIGPIVFINSTSFLLSIGYLIYFGPAPPSVLSAEARDFSVD